MILLKKLQLSNFLSYETLSLDFSEDEKILIDGNSGNGKSSIIDSIIFALYGEGRVENKSLIKRGHNKCSVSLELLSENNEVITISRAINNTGKHTLDVSHKKKDGTAVSHPAAGIKELQEWINKDLIGASYLLFANSVAYIQGNVESFVSQTASKRKELLLEILKAEDYDTYYEQARTTLVELEKGRSEASGQIIELEGRLFNLKGKEGQKEAYLRSSEEDLKRLISLQKDIEELKKEHIKVQAFMESIKTLEESIVDATRDINKVDNIIATKKLLSPDKEEAELEIELWKSREKDSALINEKLEKTRVNFSEALDIEARRNEINKKRPFVNNRFPEMICEIDQDIKTIRRKPICPSKEACPYSGDHEKELGELINKKRAYVLEMIKQNSNFSEWEKESASLPSSLDTDVGLLMAKIKGLEAEKKKAEDGEKKLRLLQIELEKAISIEEDISVLEKDLKGKKERVSTLIDKRKDLLKKNNIEEVNKIKLELRARELLAEEKKDNISRNKMLIASIERQEEESKKIESRVKDLKENKLNKLNNSFRQVSLVKDAFGSKGIENIVLDCIMPKLEDNINKTLSKLSDFKVRLDTQKKTADGNGKIDGLFITIINESNEELPFESYSGGERLKIMVAISESLASLQKVGFRIFDEVFTGLDENSSEGFADVLEGLQKDFKQILCVSHLPQIKELFDKKITILKHNSASYVK